MTIVKPKVLVTGASGFLGTNLLAELVKLKYETLAISRSKKKVSPKETVTWLQADLSQPLTYKKKVKEFNPDVVVHLAWQDIPDFSFETSNNNLSQSLEFLSFISSLPSCKKILVSGSCWELSQTQGKPSSGHQVKRVKDFIWAKNSLLSWLEKECLEKGIKLSWFRIFYVYGPRQREESLIPSILKSLKLGRFPVIKSPYASNDYIFVKDVVSAFLLAISKDAVSGIYNLGSGKFSSVIEICRLSELLVLGSDKFTKNLKENLKLEKKTPNYLADITKTTHTFGWEPKVSLEKGIEETWQFMSS